MCRYQNKGWNELHPSNLNRGTIQLPQINSKLKKSRIQVLGHLKTIPHICNFLHNRNLRFGNLTLETALICNKSCFATKQCKLPSENSNHKLCENYDMRWIASQIMHCVILQGGWKTMPCVRFHTLQKNTLKALSFKYPVENFTLDSKRLHNQVVMVVTNIRCAKN